MTQAPIVIKSILLIIYPSSIKLDSSPQENMNASKLNEPK